MIARTIVVAVLLAAAIASLAARAEAAGPDRRSEAASLEKPACKPVKVVYAGHGEAARAPCRTAP